MRNALWLILKKRRELRELEPFSIIEFFSFLELRELPQDDSDTEEDFIIDFE